MSHFCEYLTWLMGYEAFAYAHYDDRDLVQDITDKLVAFHFEGLERYLEYDRVKIIFASDDMGYKTGLLFSKQDMIHYVLEPHRIIADAAHEAGRVYLLHACGNLDEIVDYLIDDVRIDGKHSYEDAIIPVERFQERYGDRIAVLGGVDINILGAGTEEQVRERVRFLVRTCGDRGRYAVGSGNSIPSYIPVENYLSMLDEAQA